MSTSGPLAKKHRVKRFLAGVVCSLVVLELFNMVIRAGNIFAYAARYSDLVFISGCLLTGLLLLKFLLPGWRPHRIWLGGLLGVSLVKELWDTIYFMSDLREAEIVLVCIFFIAVNPYFYLLLGAVFKKRTEKIAGVFSAIRLVFSALMMTRGYAVVGMLRFDWNNDPLQLLVPLGLTVICFNWPVVSRPILDNTEKEKPPMQQIAFERTTAPKQKPDQNKLGFGNYFTDHMFLMNYDDGHGVPGESADSLGCKGWHDPRIVPYAPIALDPAAMCLHYGQEVFEGLKAYWGVDGKIRLFRPEENMARLNLSNERLCIPLIDEALAVRAVEELVKIDADWIPTQDGTSLYIRPFIFAVDPQVGVHPAKHLIFCIILSPVGTYYPEGLNPIKIFVEEKYVRAVKGGLGFTKAAANYASSLKAQEEAQALGFTQVLWLDGVERKYIEEVGTMNVFFAFENEIVTPALQGSILGGITRKSCIEILRGWGYTVNERPLALAEVVAAAKSGELKEAFGSGTAAVVSPIGALHCGGEILAVTNGEIGALTQRLYDELTGIQWGRVADTYGWTKIIA